LGHIRNRDLQHVPQRVGGIRGHQEQTALGIHLGQLASQRAGQGCFAHSPLAAEQQETLGSQEQRMAGMLLTVNATELQRDPLPHRSPLFWPGSLLGML
jgi:hypothetical protein